MTRYLKSQKFWQNVLAINKLSLKIDSLKRNVFTKLNKKDSQKLTMVVAQSCSVTLHLLKVCIAWIQL